MQTHAPDAECDGGDLDCGSGLLLIIKKHMDPLNVGQILKINSREPSVAEDLPAWCRMVGHGFLGEEMQADGKAYYVRKGRPDTQLGDDKDAARGYEWTVRVQGESSLTSKVFSRNHAFHTGQPADFNERVAAPSAVDYLLASLASCLTVGFQAHASRAQLTIDAVECTVKGKLHDVLYHLGVEESGNPAFSKISGTFYVSSPDDEAALEATWRTTLARSPVYQTLRQGVPVGLTFSIVL